MRLSELKTGESATIVKVMGHGGFRRRIMEMGFVRGQRVEVILNAPLKDPIEYKIMGYDISLRRSEADMVVGDRLSNGTYAQQNARAFHGFGNDLVRFMIKWIYGYAYSDVMTGYRAMSKPFIKTFPVLSEGFQIETELSIHAVDHRWRILNIPIDYRDRPEGSVSKLNTVSDGLKVIAMIGTLFKDYRPLKFFSLIALAFCIGGLCAGMPVVSEYLATGLVPRLPTAILAVAFMFIAALSLATGFILDAVAKVERKQWELRVYRQAESE